MSFYFITYTASNVLGIIIFGIMLAHDLRSVDRQEKQLKYDRALISFMLYFLTDSIWAGVDAGILPVNAFTAIATNFANYVVMSGITYCWLDYVMAVEQVPNRDKPVNRFAILFPFIITTIVMIVIYIVAPQLLVDESYKATTLCYAFLVVVPWIYIIAMILHSVRKAIQVENPVEKRKYLYIGFLPTMIIMSGLVEMLVMPELPLFCYSAIVLMLIFYIQSMYSQISTDPLTGLSNRGQLAHYTSQSSNLRIEGRPTFVLMMDINDFKSINDSYGHAEGDRALVIIAQSLVDMVRNHNIPVFLGRYGGDEFVLIVHPADEEELRSLILEIRERILARCESDGTPYRLSVGIGYEELMGEQDTFEECMHRADQKMYADKRLCKTGRKGVAV